MSSALPSAASSSSASARPRLRQVGYPVAFLLGAGAGLGGDAHEMPLHLENRLRADGVSLRGIAAYLDQHGVKTRGGGKWSPKVVRDILQRSAINMKQNIPDVA